MLAQWAGRLQAIAGGHIASRAISSTMLRIIGLALAFAQSVLAARLLGAHALGRAAIVVSAASVISVLATLGLGWLAVREVAAQRAAGNPNHIIAFGTFSLWVVGLLSVLGALAMLAVAPLMAHPDDFMLGALLVMPLAMIIVLRGIAQGLDRIVLSQVPAEVLRSALLLIACIITLACGWAWSTADYLLVLAATAAMAMIAAAAGLQRAWPRRDGGAVPKGQELHWIAGSLPFLGLGLVSMLQAEATTLLVGWLAGPREAGLLQPVARLMPLMALPAQAVTMAFSPRIAELWQLGQHDRIRTATRSFTLSTSLLTLGIVAVLCVGGPWILAAFGAEFTASADLLWIIGGAQMFNVLCGPLGPLLGMSGRSKWALAGTTTGLLVNIGVGIWLAPTMGAAGGALAMAAGIITWNLVLVLVTRQAAGFDPSILGALRALAAARRP